jgi:hypothetical protein
MAEATSDYVYLSFSKPFDVVQALRVIPIKTAIAVFTHLMPAYGTKRNNGIVSAYYIVGYLLYTD